MRLEFNEELAELILIPMSDEESQQLDKLTDITQRASKRKDIHAIEYNSLWRTYTLKLKRSGDQS